MADLTGICERCATRTETAEYTLKGGTREFCANCAAETAKVHDLAPVRVTAPTPKRDATAPQRAEGGDEPKRKG